MTALRSTARSHHSEKPSTVRSSSALLPGWLTATATKPCAASAVPSQASPDAMPTGTVGQENERTSGPRGGRCIARGAAGAQERDDGRPDPLRLLARVGCGRVPHHRAECMCLRAAPIVRLSWDKISRGDADVEDRVGARDIYRCKEDQRQRQKPHPTYPDGSFDVQKYTGTDSPATQRHAPTRS